MGDRAQIDVVRMNTSVLVTVCGWCCGKQSDWDRCSRRRESVPRDPRRSPEIPERRSRAPYRGGKHADELEEIVRTKYISETVVTVMALTPSTVAGRPFAAIEVGEFAGDGRLVPIGAVGSGFTAQEAQAIAMACAASPGRVRIVVRHQGRTESGKLWHARFDSIAA